MSIRIKNTLIYNKYEILGYIEVIERVIEPNNIRIAKLNSKKEDEKETLKNLSEGNFMKKANSRVLEIIDWGDYIKYSESWKIRIRKSNRIIVDSKNNSKKQ